MVRTCQDFQIDAAIVTAHIGCKNMWAVAKLLKDKLADELGIPMLVVEADFCDARPFSGEEIRARLNDFFNTVLV